MKALLAAILVCAVALGGHADARSKHRQPASVAGQFDYYVLTLSWSPSYCETHGNDVQQCGAAKPSGFVLHGLWPQFQAGGFPQNCATANRLDASARNVGQRIFPSSKLIEHEWDRHGTCSGMTATKYFELADQARNSITIPDRFQPGQGVAILTSSQIGQAFRDANPALSSRSIAVICGGPELSEVRMCLSKTLQLMNCGAGVRDVCRDSPVRIPGVR